MQLKDLKVRILGDSSSYTRAMADVEAGSKRGEMSISRLTGAVALGNLAANAAQVAWQNAKNAVGGFIESASNVQQTEQSFEVLLGSAGKAHQLLQQVSNMAAKTPFEFPELASTAQNLLAYGAAQKDILPILQQLGDLSAGNKEKFQSLALVYGQVRSAGRLMGQDLLQLTSTGIPILDALAKQLGVTKSEVRDMVSAGTVTFDDFSAALSNLAGPGGQFFGLMDKQSQTLNGRWSTLKDNFSQFGRTLLGVTNDGSVQAGGLFDILSRGFQGIINFMNTERFTQWVQTIGNLLRSSTVAAVGFFRAIGPEAVKDVKNFLTAALEVGEKVINFLEPSLAALWRTLEERLFPSLEKLWKQVLEPLMPVIGVVLVGALWLLVNVLNVVLSVVSFLVNVFSTLTGGVISAAKAIVDWFSNLPSNIKKAVSGIKDIILAPFKAAFNAISDAWNNTAGKLDFKVPSWVPGLGGKGWSMPQLPHYATGTQDFSGGWAVFGEHGPELAYLPAGSSVKTATETQAVMAKKETQASVNDNRIYHFSPTVNVGMYAGMPYEKRQIAEELWRELVRSARAQGIVLPSIGSVVLQ